MIVVTGATGALGSLIVEQLLARVPATQVSATARQLDKAKGLVARGIRVTVAGFADRDPLIEAFAGAEQALLISVNQLGEAARRLHHDAMQAARMAGVGRILYTSHAGARADSPFAPAPDHAAAEQSLLDTGVAFTSLRNGFYAESALHLISSGIEKGEIRAPEDGPVRWTARADLAEGAAAILAANGLLNGITPALVAPEAFTMSDLAQIASEVTGRDIRRVTLTDEAWQREKVAEGMPEMMAGLLLGTYQAARRGDFAAGDPTLGELIGRPPQTMRDVLTATLTPS